MTHFLERLYGTSHQSFVIFKTLTPLGYVFGPTIYQGANPPDPTTDSITGQISSGDVWIQTGPAPSLNQYIGNSWVSLASDPNSLPVPDFNDMDSAIQNAISDLATISELSDTVANAIDNALGPTVNPSFLIVSTVSYNGLPDGSPRAPFNSVQAAVDAAQTVGNTVPVVIAVMPGVYTENVTISRPLTYLTGAQGYSRATQIVGTFLIEPVSMIGDMYSSIIGLENLSLTSNSTTLSISGSYPVNFIGRDLDIQSSGSSGFFDTAIADHRVEILHASISTTGLGDAFTISNASCFLHHVNMKADEGSCFILDGGTADIDTSTMTVWNTNATSSVVKNLGGVINISGSNIVNNGANGSGFYIENGSTQVTSTGFNVSNGAGYLADGANGSIFAYANIWFAPSSNNLLSNAVSVNALALATEPRLS